MYGHDAFASIFSSFMCGDTVSYYDTNITSFFINYYATSNFWQHSMHDTSYDTAIVTSLTHPQFLQTPCTTHGYSRVGQRRRKNVQYYSGVIINMYQGQKVVSATFLFSILAVLILLGSVVTRVITDHTANNQMVGHDQAWSKSNSSAPTRWTSTRCINFARVPMRDWQRRMPIFLSKTPVSKPNEPGNQLLIQRVLILYI
jgi:hypothetical protein